MVGLLIQQMSLLYWWDEGHKQCDQKKSPNIYKSCPKMISLEKLYILTPLQKLSKNVVRSVQIKCCQKQLKVAQSPINRQIWSNWPQAIAGHAWSI